MKNTINTIIDIVSTIIFVLGIFIGFVIGMSGFTKGWIILAICTFALAYFAYDNYKSKNKNKAQQ